MSDDFRDYYTKIPVEIRRSFGSTSKTAEYVYNDMQTKIAELKKEITRLEEYEFMYKSCSK